MKLRPGNLLLILSGAVVLVRIEPALPGAGWVAGVALIVALLVVVAQLAPRNQDSAGNIDIQEVHRTHAVAAYAASLAVAAVAVIVAIFASPIGYAILGITAAWVLVWWLPQSRFTYRTNTFTVNQPPATVFAFLADSRNQLKYVDGVQAVEKLTDGPIGSGTQFRVRFEIPAEFRASGVDPIREGVEEIVRYEPPGRLATRAIAVPASPNLDVTTIEGIDGASRVTTSMTIETPFELAVLGGMLAGLLKEGSMQRRRELLWERAKEIMETDSSA